MRAIAAIVIGFGVAGFGFAGLGFVSLDAAHAADLPLDGSASYSTYGDVSGQRSGSILIYDSQPGVVVRAYWQVPWRNRHYFPRTGKQPRIGRAENLSAPRPHYQMAESYYRAWSTNALFPPPVAAPVPVSKTFGPLK
jgi:hypothetical protein